jgi:hypothetical protein
MANADRKMDLDYCIFISIELWLEFIFVTKASSMISPYLLPFLDDLTIP